MLLEWTPPELAAINQLAVRDDTSPEQVIKQAVRLYQMYRMGYVKIKWPPSVIDATFEVVEPIENQMNLGLMKNDSST